jgi:metal-sulfur cluster biosynthetic enzyme
MAENISLQDVQNALERVMHPAINSSLVALGIARDIEFDGSEATLTLALPALNIPAGITNYMIDSLAEALEEIGIGLKINTREMDDEERQRFLSMEQENWKGL